MTVRCLCFPVLLMLAVSCATSRKLAGIREGDVSASISLQDDDTISSSDLSVDSQQTPYRDTLTINVDGHQMLVMRALRDDETGKMVATEQLQAAIVTARFRNVAERHGKVDLKFDVCIPKEMADSRWQVRLSPEMYMLSDTVSLDEVFITGKEYRKAQLRGYQQYERFLSRIINDPGRFVDRHSLETFLERNIPEVFAFRKDSSFVADTVFESAFGVTQKQALDHYTNKIAVYFNDRRKMMKDYMFTRYVKAPIRTDHIRLDSVIVDLKGDFHYLYSQTVSVSPKLKKVEISMTGSIYEQEKKLYSIPQTDGLAFYISSLSSLVDGRERYLTTVIERKAVANASWNIDFSLGDWNIDENLGDNCMQISDIKRCFVNLIENETFDMDSITVSAFASPEGQSYLNESLSRKRAESSLKYFRKYLEFARDSIRKDRGLYIDVGENMSESRMAEGMKAGSEIAFKATASGENWPLLDHLVSEDSLICDRWRESYAECSAIRDFDQRESAMKKEAFYPYMKENLYPLLRTVQFNFYLHRKGMVKDTVHTTVIDSVYMSGVQAIRDRDYETAVKLLMPYGDFNTAIAYASLDRNRSALNILEKLDRTAAVNYMLALVCSRMGDVQKAVECYVESCRQDGSFVHRGNLDPEISELIKNYKLNNNSNNLQTDLL